MAELKCIQKQLIWQKAYSKIGEKIKNNYMEKFYNKKH